MTPPKAKEGKLGDLKSPQLGEQHSVIKSLTQTWREELDEYGQLHSIGCEVNSEYGADVGTEPADCCENMRLIAGFVQEQINRENMRWVTLARAHRPYCRPEGSKMLTRAIRRGQVDG